MSDTEIEHATNGAAELSLDGAKPTEDYDAQLSDNEDKDNEHQQHEENNNKAKENGQHEEAEEEVKTKDAEEEEEEFSD